MTKKKQEALPYYDEPPTKLEMLVDQVSKTASSDAVGSVHSISLRVPTIPFSTIQAIAKHSGMSMNKTIVSLIDVALDELWKGLSEDDCQQIQALRAGFLRNLIDATPDSQVQAAKGEI